MCGEGKPKKQIVFQSGPCLLYDKSQVSHKSKVLYKLKVQNLKCSPSTISFDLSRSKIMLLWRLVPYFNMKLVIGDIKRFDTFLYVSN